MIFHGFKILLFQEVFYGVGGSRNGPEGGRGKIDCVVDEMDLRNRQRRLIFRVRTTVPQNRSKGDQTSY